MPRRLALLAALAASPLAAADDAKTGFLTKTFKNADGHESPYVVFVPHNYDGKKAVPVVLFLHGAGETKFANPPKLPPGVPSKTPVEVGLGPYVRMREKTFPAIVVIPRAEEFGWQAGSANANRALAMLDEVMKEYKCDPDRVYLTGLSMGGFGTWSIAAAHPDRWAAIAPVCGGIAFPAKKGGKAPAGPTPDEAAAKIKNIPCWCWHGAADPVVKVDLSRVMIEALKKAGADPRYTELEHIGHNSWDSTYASEDLYAWLFRQKKSK